MKIVFTKHAQDKFVVLRRHGVFLTKSQVIRAIKEPELVDYTRLPLLIAQHSLDTRRVLRVVYRIEQNVILVVTFYPGRKSQYER